MLIQLCGHIWMGWQYLIIWDTQLNDWTLKQNNNFTQHLNYPFTYEHYVWITCTSKF